MIETDLKDDPADEDVLEALEAAEPASLPPAPTPADTDTDTDEETSATARRFPASDWAEIETHWECGTMTAVGILAKYGMSEKALRSHLKRHKIIRNSKRHLIKKDAEVKIMGAVAAAADPIAIAFDQKRKGRISQSRETFINQSSALTQIENGFIKQVLDGTCTMADRSNDFKALRHAHLAAERIMDSRLRCLNADADIDEAKLPTLIFRDLSEEEIQDMAAADKDEDLDFDFPEAPVDLEDDDVVEEGVPSPPVSS